MGARQQMKSIGNDRFARVPRRTLLQLGAAAAEDFARMRQQWRELHVTSGYAADDPVVAPPLARITNDTQHWWSSMAKGPGRTYLWSDAQLAIQQSIAISVSFTRLRSMALAWATPGSGLAGDSGLLADTIAGMDWMIAHWYSETQPEIGNWYEWRISGPRALNDAAVLPFGHLTSAQVQAYGRATAYYTPAPSGTTANRALTSHVVVGRGALLSNATTVASGVSGLPPVLAYVTSADGFYRNGSFIQHSCYPYAGSYGASILDALAPLLATVAGTQWQVDASVVADWIGNAFDPLLWRGAFMDMTMGRVISRPDQQNQGIASCTLTAALGLIPAVPAARQPWLRSVLKEWILADASGDPLPDRTIPVRLTAASLVNDGTVTRRGPLVVSRVYPNQARIVHRLDRHQPGRQLGRPGRQRQ
jgi:hyaluronate lyase